MQCAACGFIDDTVTPADAAVALRSYPRRYRAVLVRPDDEDRADDVVRRPASDGWSALDHAAHAAASLDAAAEALRMVSIQEDPVVALAPERREPASESTTVNQVLDRLAAAATSAAEAVGRIKGKDWDRTARTSPDDSDDQPTTALDLARHAVHEGVHHLRAAEAAVDEAVSSR
jgi:uncharacterized damage-inducible protein DinB